MSRALTLTIGLTFSTLILSLACSGDTLTTPTSVGLTGTWIGDYQVTTCETDYGDTRGCGQNQNGKVTLTLTQDGEDIEGTIDWIYAIPPLPISGRFDGTTLTLAGRRFDEFGTYTADHRLSDWKTTVRSPRMQDGRFTWTLIQSNTDPRSAYTYTFRRQCTVYDLTRTH